MNPFISASMLIIHVVFDSYIIILLLRFILQKLHASWHNPLSKFLIQVTEKPLKPLRKIAPGIKGFDLSIILFAFILQAVEIILLYDLSFGGMPHLSGAFIISCGEIANKFVTIYFYAIIINAIGSWIPQTAHPIMDSIDLIVEPALSPIRRLIPLVAGIDISPIVALLGLTLLRMLIIAPILALN